MTVDQPTHTWHHDLNINGQPYPTRHPAPNYGDTSDAYLGDLPTHTRQYLRALHEAAHAIAAISANGHIHYARITPTAQLAASTGAVSGGDVSGCNLIDGRAVATFYGAGERAENHYLHQAGLWTPTRSAGIELGALRDRERCRTLNPHIGFGTGHNDYAAVHDLADQLVTRHWHAILTVADTLTNRLHLTGDEIAHLARIPNGPHATGCTGTPTA